MEGLLAVIFGISLTLTLGAPIIEPVTYSNLKFVLYTNNVPSGRTIRASEFIKLDSSTDFTNPSVIIIHGFTGSPDEQWIIDLSQALFAREPTNVFAVDWSYHAGLSYDVAVNYAREVGTLVGAYIVSLHEEYGASYDLFKIIGHSLGAQVSGFVGQTFTRLTGLLIPQITGLDPAGPLFDEAPDDQKLSTHDGELVVTIHTDSGLLGTKLPVGHVSFFPNGGTPMQPGCTCEPSESACAHNRAPAILIESVRNSSAFLSTRCEHYLFYLEHVCDENPTITIGGNFTVEDAGNYYLNTKPSSPFSY